MKRLNKSKNAAKRKAFALVLAIGAMAFMVLLTLTLSAIISSKLRILNAQKQAREARSHAVLGMSIAISNLQRTVGKDNAITVQSSIFDQDPETVRIDNVKTPYVVGTFNVKKDASNLTARELQDEQRDLVDVIKNGGNSSEVSWLVSGQKRLKNPISESPEDLSDETVKLAEYSLLNEYPAEYGGKISASDKTEKVEVKAGKVRFEANQGQSGEGAYAWWVSDESQKAKINLTRPEMYLDKEMPNVSSLSGQAPVDPRVPQVINTSFVSELSELGLSPFARNYNEENSKNIAKISTLDELPIVDASLTEWAKNNKGDYTAVSVGLPVDVTQGRLKEDLTVYLYTGKGLKDNDPIIRGGNTSSDKEYTGVDFGLRSYTKHLPTFGILRSFATYALDKTTFQAGVNPQAQVINTQASENTHGVYPIVESAEWMLFPAYDINISNRNAAFTLNPSALSSFRLNINYIMYLRVVLRNPFNVTINQSNYILRIATPIAAYLSRDEGNPEMLTRWVHHYYDSAGKEQEKFINVVFKASRTNANRAPHFADFLEDYMDNNMPAMNFNLRSIKLLPGESVELCQPKIAADQNEFSPAKVQNLSSSKNLLEPGKIQVSDGYSSQWAALPQKCFKISTDLNLTFNASRSNIPENISEFTFDEASKCYKKKVSLPNGQEGEEIIRPFIYDKFKSKNSSVDVSGMGDAFDGWPLFEFEQNTSSGRNIPYRFNLAELTSSKAKGRSYTRNALELLSSNKKRLWKHDLTEWQSASGANPSTYNGSSGRDKTHNFYRHDDNQMNPWGIDSVYFSDDIMKDYVAIVQNTSKFFDTTLKFGVNGGHDIPLFYNKNSYAVQINNLLDKSRILFTIRMPNWNSIFNGIFSSYNYRATQLIDSDYLNDSHVIRRSCTNGTVGMQDCGSASRYASYFFGQKASTGYHTWSNRTYPVDGMKASDNRTLSGNYPNHYGLLSPISGAGKHDYDGLIFAPFDLPRKETDLMSLAHFRHANLSPMPWQPSYAFAESYASPFLRRQNIVEFNKGNENISSNSNYSQWDYIYDNETIDISYLLNASMWDRFFLSTIPQQSEAFTPMAGMRMPNTRLFLTSLPEDTKDLKASETAFEEVASHIGVDGAFNVNSTSYEAWRSVLGGLLGVKRRTLTNGTINSDGDRPDNPDEFKMPNPGDLNPLTIPEEGKRFSYIDLSVGRRISESEIDMLAREIVAEVKRRAPFFSLADFVNRRLEEFTSENDKDANYRSMMGTLAAAIRRSEHIQDRPDFFFNDNSMEEYFNQVNAKNGYSVRCVLAEYVTCYDNRTGTPNQIGPGQQGSWRDIGEQLREAKREFFDAALQVPHNETKAQAWSTRGARGLLNQADLLSAIGPVITVRGDTFVVRAYGESKNALMGNTSKAYCEAVVQRTAEPVRSGDNKVAPESEFGRKFKIVSFKWLTNAEL